ncbi:MAG: F0F1 ATP synthase subunit epsilon [Terracidiphilus sp.]
MAEEINQLRVRLVTPERTLFDHPAASVDLPAKNGYMEVLYGHAPLVAELGAGDVIVHGGSGADGETGGPEGSLRWNVSWGFAEVLGDRVTILASDALKPEEIDVTRAQRRNSSHAAIRNGTRPAIAKRLTLKRCASSPKLKRRLRRRRRSTDRLCLYELLL